MPPLLHVVLVAAELVVVVDFFVVEATRVLEVGTVTTVDALDEVVVLEVDGGFL